MKVSEYFTNDNAVFAAKVAGGMVVGGACLAATGAGVEWLGRAVLEYVGTEGAIVDLALNALGSSLEFLGTTAFVMGKVSAYTILVPSYLLGYTIPKWILNDGLLSAYECLRDRVIVPLAQLASYAGEAFVKIVQDCFCKFG